MRAAGAYADYLLEKAHESHAHERWRISRELHDGVAHSIMVAFRSLEIFEMYRAKDASKAQTRLELAKSTTQEALELTRSLSRELRSTSAEEGLEVALSELLGLSVSQYIRSWASAEGDESLITSQVRDELFLILREGIRNAVAHSRAGTITIDVNINENRVKATVEDDGRGFEPGKEANRNSSTGLASMKERVRFWGALSTWLPLQRRTRKSRYFCLCPRGASTERQWHLYKYTLVDDHALFREGIVEIFSAEDGMMIIGEGAYGLEGIALVEKEKPEVVLLE